MSTNTQAWLWTAGIFVALVAGSALLDAAGLLPEEDQNEVIAREHRDKLERIESQCSDASAAYIMSQKFVKDRLKAPSSANFPWEPENAERTAPCSFRIASWVEAQNAFGVSLRTSYQADMWFDRETEQWSAIAIHLAE